MNGEWNQMPQQQAQAFDPLRFSTEQAGQSGGVFTGVYDGRGTAAEGGDNFNTIKADGYFTSEGVKDQIRLSTEGLSGNSAMMPLKLLANDKWDQVGAYLDGTVVKVREGAFSLKT